MTFEQIQKANQSIRTTDIKGKEYAEVNQRIKAFRMVYPTGFIFTEIQMLQDGICTMVARVGYYDEEGRERILGMGTAQEKESSSFINKTSYIENCETSAVGRALGMAGFGIDTSVASFEEVANAIENQKTKKKIGQEQINYIADNSTQEQIIAILEKYNIEELKDLDEATATKIILRINQLKMEGSK